MLASAVASQFTEAPETITVTYAIDNWLMTPGSWLTVQEFLKPSQVFAEGEWRRAPLMVRSSVFDFGRSRGRQRVLAYPGGEIVTVPRHTGARKVAVQMTASTFASPAAARILPAPIVVGSLAARAALRIARRRLTGRLPDRVHKAERAGSSFEIVVEATDGDGARRATAQGSDIYGISAITSANLAMTLADGIADSGVLSPAQAVDAPSFLAQLRFDGFSCQL
ncbi:MAG: hypothetical protein ACRDMH_00155 [Solirubrobacterales bacterium]